MVPFYLVVQYLQNSSARIIIKCSYIIIIMDRRHRINDSEIKWLTQAAFYRLMGLSYSFSSKGVGDEAEALFKFLWRVTRHSQGKPGYPEITSESINQFIMENNEAIIVAE